MTRDEIKSRVPVLQAWLDQQAIQFRWHGRGNISSWTDFTEGHHGDHPDIFNPDKEWRKKPAEVRPMEWWIDFCPEKSDTIWHYEPDPRSVRGRLVHVREVLSDPPANAAPPPQTEYPDPERLDRNP